MTLHCVLFRPRWDVQWYFKWIVSNVIPLRPEGGLCEVGYLEFRGAFRRRPPGWCLSMCCCGCVWRHLLCASWCKTVNTFYRQPFTGLFNPLHTAGLPVSLLISRKTGCCDLPLSCRTLACAWTLWPCAVCVHTITTPTACSPCSRNCRPCPCSFRPGPAVRPTGKAHLWFVSLLNHCHPFIFSFYVKNISNLVKSCKNCAVKTRLHSPGFPSRTCRFSLVSTW